MSANRLAFSSTAWIKSCAGWPVVFVDDDSPNDTANEVKAIGTGDPRVRCLRRIGRRGLAGACIEGKLSSHAQLIAVVCHRRSVELRQVERSRPVLPLTKVQRACA